jgi:hypothetical protein
MSYNENERKAVSVVGIIIWRWGMGIAALVAAYGAMWVKLNAPSRDQFNLLTVQVQGLREDMIRMSSQRDRVEKLESKLEAVIERTIELERRSTPRRTIP